MGQEGQISTMYALDDYLSGFSFSLGTSSYIYLKGRDGKEDIYNKNTQISFGRWGKGDCLFGIEGANTATVIDLGAGRRGQGRFSLFSFLKRREQRIYFVLPKGGEETVANFRGKQSSRLLRVKPKEGHVLVLKINESRSGEKWESIYVAMHVLFVIPGRMITFRWRLL